MSERITTMEDSAKGKPARETRYEEIAELEVPIKKIIEKIKERIENGKYGLIIGDDASGRIPAIILGNFIIKISEQRNLEKPNIIFIPGKLKSEEFNWRKVFGLRSTSKRKQYEKLDEYVSSHGASKERKILIVTDTVKSGDSLKTLVGLLKRAGYRCDIATIGIETPMIGRGIKESLVGTDIISGEYRIKDRDRNQNTPLIYEHESRKLTGVYKIPGDKVSKPIKLSALPEGINPEDVNPEDLNIDSSRQEIQGFINQAREDANIIVDHLVDWYKSQNNGR